jgi:ABC-type multidrug transport system ATPase subunit
MSGWAATAEPGPAPAAEGRQTGQAVTVPQARLVAEGIGKAYGDRRVLEAVDLALWPSSLVAVAGRNGAGKSTLLACLAGTIRHEGRVLIEGESGPPQPGLVALLPQRIRLPSSASGREILRLFAPLARARGGAIPPPEGFLTELDSPVGRLSGGEAQRLALAAVLVGRPDVVLLDEPFANLDEAAREQAMALIRLHRDAGASVLVTSPTALELVDSVDRVVLVRDRGIAFDGPPAAYAEARTGS